ncbi:MAG: DUF3761 domain-containing protein [Acidobacteria bacterium]|nr:DUF3761 domain-containing protein [Acidobacteriota bacterium]
MRKLKRETVRRPEDCSATRKGATAQCRDRSDTFSRSPGVSCSHHCGVAKWLQQILSERKLWKRKGTDVGRR